MNKQITIVDPARISMPSSTKNADKKRDPDAHSTKKGSTWHFGYKAHIGVDKDGREIRYKINSRPSQAKNAPARSRAQIKRRERKKSSVRAKVEHVFAVVKGRFRYRSLRKQTAKLNMVFALANLILAVRPALAA